MSLAGGGLLELDLGDLVAVERRNFRNLFVNLRRKQPTIVFIFENIRNCLACTLASESACELRLSWHSLDRRIELYWINYHSYIQDEYGFFIFLRNSNKTYKCWTPHSLSQFGSQAFFALTRSSSPAYRSMHLLEKDGEDLAVLFRISSWRADRNRNKSVILLKKINKIMRSKSQLKAWSPFMYLDQNYASSQVGITPLTLALLLFVLKTRSRSIRFLSLPRFPAPINKLK